MARGAKVSRSLSAERPLLSHTTILILSSFLIGIAAGRMTTPNSELMVYFTGVFGLVAYFGLGQLARKRQERAELRALERAAHQLESRMDRHIPRGAMFRNRRDDTHAAAPEQQVNPAPAPAPRRED